MQRVGITAITTENILTHYRKLPPDLGETLALQEDVIDFLKRNSFGVYRLPYNFARWLSRPDKSLYWRQVMYHRRDIREWGSLISREGIRVVAQLPSKLYSATNTRFYTHFNTTNTRQFTQMMFWVEGMVELFNTAGLDTDCKIIVEPGMRLSTKTVSMKSFHKRYLSLPIELQNRLCIKNNGVFSLEDCLKLSRTYFIPVVYDARYGAVSDPAVLARVRDTWGCDEPLSVVGQSTQLPSGFDLLIDTAESDVVASEILAAQRTQT